MHRWLIAVVLILLTGCAQQQRLEKLGMSDCVALDAVSDKIEKASDTRLSIAVAVPRAGKSGTPQTDILQTKAASPKEGRTNLSRKIDKIIVSGQLGSMILGKELAKQGIWKTLDSYRRDYTVGEQLKIVVVNGSAVEMLTHSYPQIHSIGAHIDQLLNQETKIHEIPNVTLYSFVRDYFDDGIDPISPLIKLEDDKVEVDGIALFKQDRYVGKISRDKTVMFSILHHRLKNAEFNIRFMDQSSGNQEGAMISSIISKREMSIEKQQGDGTPEIVIHVQLSGIVLEYTGPSTFKKADEQQALNKDLSEAIREQLQTIVNQVQHIGGDNLGVGTYVRNSMKYEEWKKLNWDSLYPNANIRVEVEAAIRDYGMIR